MSFWRSVFLQEHPSIGLAFFRVAAATATGLHVFPSFFHLRENYLAGAFKTYNTTFFTPGFLELIAQSPDWLVIFLTGVLIFSWFLFLIGLFTQASGAVMLASLIYFYALNNFYIGSSLAWDLLLVTLYLLCLTPYPGDYFSVDAVRREDPVAYKVHRPFFIQRLLQIQIATTFFFTAVYKIYPAGNWLSDNPLYYLMLYPHEGTTKYFLLREFFAAHPQLCYGLGIFILGMEFLLPILLFLPRTRISAIYLGFLFHVILILTLDVPAIFFFLFPSQLLLFIDPPAVVSWIEQKRLYNRSASRSQIVYDGHCGFCRHSLAQLKTMDLFDAFEPVDFQGLADLTLIHPRLTKKAVASQLHLVEPDGKLFGGFEAFRRMCFSLPMCYPLIPVLYVPGMGVLGPLIYQWVAQNRYFFHSNAVCGNNACFR